MKKRIYQRLFAVLLVFCLVLSLNISVKASPDQDKAGENADRISVDAGLENTDETDLNEGQKEAEAQTHGENAENDASVDDAAVNEENGTQAQKGRASDAGTAEAASLEEDGISPLAANGTIAIGESIQLSGKAGSSHSWKQTGGNGQVNILKYGSQNPTITGIAAGTVEIQHTYSDGYSKRTEAFEYTVTNEVKKIEAKVYLRYSNTVPNPINAGDGAAAYGPSGNDVPYITVTVDLEKVRSKEDDGYTKYFNGVHYWQYYSIDESDQKDNSRTDEVRQEAAAEYWREVIYPAIDAEDQEGLNQIFGEGNYIGYVLKIENTGWHIDGVLADKPPIYTVELYQEGTGQCILTVSKGEGEVSYATFKDRLEQTLGGTGYQYTEKDDEVVVTYQKDGRTYQSTITPKEDYSENHIYPLRDSFAYREMIKNTFYLCRLKITDPIEVTGSVSMTKTVKGTAANPNEHFTFTLAAKDLAGQALTGDYTVNYSGTNGCTSSHPAKVTFVNGSASLSLKNGETATIVGLPGGISVNVKENASGYTPSVLINSQSGNYDANAGVNITIPANGTTSIEMTNTLNAVPQTGFHMDSLPGIVLVLCVICAGVFYLLMARRKGNFRR